MVKSNFFKVDENTFDMQESTEIQPWSLFGLIDEIKKGALRIPDFQRDYVWSKDQVKDLLDSIWNGYPIGSVLMWKTKEALHERDPMNLNLSAPQNNSDRYYLLDGQQRLITLYSVIHGKLALGDKKSKYHVFFNCQNKEFLILDEKEVESKKLKLNDGFLDLSKLFIFDRQTGSPTQNEGIIKELAISQKTDWIVTFSGICAKFTSLTFPVIINSQNLSTACKIFEKLNNTGTSLTIVDLMVATTYKNAFNLRDKIIEINDSLESQDFGISERIILQSLSACIKGGTTRDDIIDSSNEVQPKWDLVINALLKSIDFLRDKCSVPVSKFLPNEILLAPLTRFFYYYGERQLTESHIKKLKRYFWVSSLDQRYASSQDSVAESDMKLFDKILAGSNEEFERPLTKIDPISIEFENMSFGSSFSKAVLCFFASRKPREFKNNEEINLKQTFSEANLRQLHHIFPKNFIKQKYNKKMTEKIKYLSNSITNISLISRTENRDIWDKAPSIYLNKFKEENNNLISTLNTHMIGDFDNFGIESDDFQKFISARSKMIANEINEFIKLL